MTQFHVIDDYDEADAAYLHVVLTDDADAPITTTAEWEARFDLFEDPTSEETVIEKSTQDGDITFEEVTEDDIADMDAVTNTNGDKAVILIEGESPDGATAGDTADLLGTADGRAEEATYYYAVRAWNADGHRSTVVDGELIIKAPGIQ